MKNLLVPTDFSECADQALEAAAQLAHRFGAKLHLFHLMEVPEDWAQQEEERKALQSVKEKLKECLRRYPEIQSSCRYTTNGGLPEAVKNYATEHGIDLIVMGSHGVSGKSEYFIGSNTQRVIRTVNCSTLVIKSPPGQLDFQRVVFASGFNENEKEAFRRFKDFVRHFIPEIHLVAIHTSSLFDPPYTVTKEAMEDFKALCNPFPCTTHIFKDFTVERGIRRFSEDLGAQLIGISNHQRHPLRRMLIGSKVEALINHADAPVLTIDYREETEKQK